MEEYVIFRYDVDGKKRYVESIYKTSVSSDTDISDGIKFNDKDLALKIRDYLNSRESYEFKVCKIETKVEEIE